MLASAGWAATVIYDQTTIPKPANVPNHKECWTDGNLHALMQQIRNYPASDSAFFGTAANKMQREVPRAFLRSASHEVVHGSNQIHQEQEGGADNSIMTTTPSVANVLGTATTGDPGVFPDDIRLKVNTRVRHHLAHFSRPRGASRRSHLRLLGDGTRTLR